MKLAFHATATPLKWPPPQKLNQLKFIMRFQLIVGLLLSVFIQVSASTYAQNVSLKVKDMPLDQVFKLVEGQTEYVFLYDDPSFTTQKVSLAIQHAPIEQVLEACLENLPITYKIVDRNILFKRDESKTKPRKGHISQPESIKGQVRDSVGNPLSGVSIVIKGTSRGVTSNAEGRFQLAASNGEVMVFSLIGYQRQELTITAQNQLQVVLKIDLSDLEEVVVIGYGQQKKRDLTAAVSSFKPTEENARAVLSPDQLIQGRMPGVQVSAGSGSPGTVNRVSIRGIGSLSATNEPLYVIDGVPVVNQNAALLNFGENMNPLALLNPSDIESVEVLKDAASAAIYGSRATNGVILITTKSGKSSQTKFGVDAFTGVSIVPNTDKMKMAGPDLYLSVINEAIDNFNTQYNYTPGATNYMEHKENPFPGEPGTDWFDLITRPAHTSSLSLSFMGGTEKTSVYLSGNYLSQEGAFIDQKFTRYTGKLNLTHKLYSWLEFGANTSYSYSKNKRVPGSNLGTTMMGRSLLQRPFDRPFKPNGDYYLGGTDELIYHNPFQIINEQNVSLDNYRFLGSFFGTATIADGLKFKTMLGTDLTYTLDNIYYAEDHPYGTGIGVKYDNRRFTPNILWENTLNYNKTFNKLSVEGLLGYSYQKINLSSSNIEGSGFPSPSFQQLSVAASILSAGTSLTESALMSIFGRSNLSWDNKYLLSLSLRADGSSKFHPDKRWGYFPSVSAGWNVSSEPFWSLAGTTAKIRGSYGETGNQDGISSYAYHAQMSGGRNYNNQSGIGVSTNGNRNLTWETARQYGAGLDLGLLGGKLNLTADYFIKKTDNLLYSKPEPSTSGFTSIISNIGSMENKGWEFLLNAHVPLGAVQWSSDFNISFIKNKVTSLIGEEALLIGANMTLQVGQEVGSFYMYKQLGIYQSDQEVPESLYKNGVRAGDVIYEDLDGNGAINVSDRQIIGTANPNFYGGWNNSFSYKNFDFNIFFTYSHGNKVYANYRANTDRLGSGFMNMTEQVANERWSGPGTSNTTPRAIYGNTWNTQNSSRFLEDGSYIRLRALNFGYTLPTQVANKMGMKRLRVYVQGDNLYLWTKYRGFDPEVTSDFDPQFIGQDNLILPQLRSFNVGVNIGF